MRTWYVLECNGYYFQGFRPSDAKEVWTPVRRKALFMGVGTAKKQRKQLNTRCSIKPVCTDVGRH